MHGAAGASPTAAPAAGATTLPTARLWGWGRGTRVPRETPLLAVPSAGPVAPRLFRSDWRIGCRGVSWRVA